MSCVEQVRAWLCRTDRFEGLLHSIVGSCIRRIFFYWLVTHVQVGWLCYVLGEVVLEFRSDVSGEQIHGRIIAFHSWLVHLKKKLYVVLIFGQTHVHVGWLCYVWGQGVC